MMQIRIITNNLKTYQTNDEDEDYFESLDVLAKIIKSDLNENSQCNIKFAIVY
ncbi:MAG: hypothetical protein PHV32_05300 [Eubacteriales bacterium]|nr:hypothetical protein [Eubacteriales bacterium]